MEAGGAARKSRSKHPLQAGRPKNPDRTAPPRVALVIETSTSFGRRLLSGIAAYLRENGHWSVYFGERASHDPVPHWLKGWKGDGIISRIASPEIRQVIAGKRLPVVDLNEQLADMGVPLISNDHSAIGIRAAQHLLERSFTNFGYVGHAGLYWSDRRGRAFQEYVGKAGCSCEEYASKVESLRTLRQGSWELEMDAIARWVARLPKPVAIMATDDFRGLQLLAACRMADVAVPEQAAVIGVGADEVACELADPPLSSVVLNAWRMGYEAARLLDGLMRGERVARGEVLIPPLDVASRQSTEVTAIADPVVAKAMRFIRERASDGVNVEDVLRHLSMSRTALQDHFRKAQRRTIHDAIVDSRIGRIKELLIQTSLSLEEIAARTGLKYPEYLSSIFKRRTGWTPARYRREYGRTPGEPPPAPDPAR